MGHDEARFSGLDETQSASAPDGPPAKSTARAVPAGKEAKHHDGHRDRLRERFAEAGSTALADYELLEIIQPVLNRKAPSVYGLLYMGFRAGC